MSLKKQPNVSQKENDMDSDDNIDLDELLKDIDNNDSDEENIKKESNNTKNNKEKNIKNKKQSYVPKSPSLSPIIEVENRKRNRMEKEEDIKADQKNKKNKHQRMEDNKQTELENKEEEKKINNIISKKVEIEEKIKDTKSSHDSEKRKEKWNIFVDLVKRIEKHEKVNASQKANDFSIMIDKQKQILNQILNENKNLEEMIDCQKPNSYKNVLGILYCVYQIILKNHIIIQDDKEEALNMNLFREWIQSL